MNGLLLLTGLLYETHLKKHILKGSTEKGVRRGRCALDECTGPSAPALHMRLHEAELLSSLVALSICSLRSLIERLLCGLQYFHAACTASKARLRRCSSSLTDCTRYSRGVVHLNLICISESIRKDTISLLCYTSTQKGYSAALLLLEIHCKAIPKVPHLERFTHAPLHGTYSGLMPHAFN